MATLIIVIIVFAAILLLVSIGIIAFAIYTYNKLVTLRNKVKNSWAHVDAQLQRRFDLIPNLVDIIKGFAIREEQLLENVIAIRTQFSNAQTNKEKLFVDNQLNSLLVSLYQMLEHYPSLKMDRSFLQLQNALTEIEEDISYARQFYNDVVTIYNNNLMKFPNNILGSIFGFKEETLFDANKEAETPPRIFYKTEQKCPVCNAIVSGNRTNCEYCGTPIY